ncbi:hypothetical protein [Alteromonas portus]|uniref:hypothetical protein n=1 Tax=Alteromonas portus TaxID=2565549 RepID=UPI003BF87636
MNEPNFASYTLEELEDILTQIDKAQFPDRVLTIKKEIARRRSGAPAENHSPLDTTNSSPHNTKKGKKSARGIVLAVWPATVVFSVYFGKIPSRNGFIHYAEEPRLFIICLLVFIGVGFYFYHSRDDT